MRFWFQSQRYSRSVSLVWYFHGSWSVSDSESKTNEPFHCEEIVCSHPEALANESVTFTSDKKRYSAVINGSSSYSLTDRNWGRAEAKPTGSSECVCDSSPESAKFPKSSSTGISFSKWADRRPVSQHWIGNPLRLQRRLQIGWIPAMGRMNSLLPGGCHSAQSIHLSSGLKRSSCWRKWSCRPSHLLRLQLARNVTNRRAGQSPPNVSDGQLERDGNGDL